VVHYRLLRHPLRRQFLQRFPLRRVLLQSPLRRVRPRQLPPRHYLVLHPAHLQAHYGHTLDVTLIVYKPEH
jgi:hypothetical protein